MHIGVMTRLGAPPAPRVLRQRSSVRAIAKSRVIVAKASAESDTVDPRRAVTASLAALVVATAGSSAFVAFAEDSLLTDYVSDTKDLIQKQRDLLREGKGDVDAYFAKAEAYFAGYKWDHKGHTN